MPLLILNITMMEVHLQNGFCNINLTLEHIFKICPLYNKHRKLLKDMSGRLAIPYDIPTILSSLFPGEIIITFLKEAKLYTLI